VIISGNRGESSSNAGTAVVERYDTEKQILPQGVSTGVKLYDCISASSAGDRGSGEDETL